MARPIEFYFSHDVPVIIIRSKNKNTSPGVDSFYYLCPTFSLPSARGVLAEGATFFLLTPDFDVRKLVQLSPTRLDKVENGKF